ncbi:MAG: hypothetical protein IPM42_09190 [Saprospiraceae bacterium]|nr:hypothetical protein [Saprospiraceae bacterium]
MLEGAVRHPIWVDNFNITWVSSHTGREIFPDAAFYPYIIPNGIFTCAVWHQISVDTVRYQIWVDNFNITWVSSSTGRDIFLDAAFYPYIIPNGISACAVRHQIWIGAVRHQIWVDNFNITWVSSRTGRDIFPDADFYPYFIPNGIFTCTVRYQISVGAVGYQTRVSNFWKSQTVMSNSDKMGLKKPPYASTEQGVQMLSAILDKYDLEQIKKEGYYKKCRNEIHVELDGLNEEAITLPKLISKNFKQLT